MNQKIDILKRFFKNRYSREDYREMKKLVLANDPELEQLMQRHWNEYRNESLWQEKDLSHTKMLLDRRLTETQNVSRIRSLFTSFSRVAAVLIFPLLLALGFLYFQLNEYLSQKEVLVEVVSPAGSRTSLSLPDGSQVWLNGDSYIRYPAVFSKNRKVEMQGEVFFKVHSDPEHPFFVDAKGISVTATGTEFNVFAYDDDPEINVILKEGKVSVSDADRRMIREMEAGSRLKVGRAASDIAYDQINAESYSGWINGKLIFENAGMPEVVKRLERWYGVSIQLVDPELSQLHFKATFIHESIEEALKLLQLTATFNYTFAKRQIKEDGTWDPPRIYITKN